MVQESASVEASQESKEVRMEIRYDSAKYARIRDVANYAAYERIIPEDHRGNITGWVNYCLDLGEELLKQRAHQKRGPK